MPKRRRGAAERETTDASKVRRSPRHNGQNVPAILTSANPSRRETR